MNPFGAMQPASLKRLRSRARSSARSAVRALNELPYGTLVVGRGLERLGPRFQEHFYQLAQDLDTPVRSGTLRVRREDFAVDLPISSRWPLSWRVAISAYVHERGIQRFCRRFREQGDPGRLILDVGANHGLFSLPFMAHGYRCVLFEPQSSCLDYVAEAVAVNRIASAPQLVSAVLSESAGELRFYTSRSSFFSSFDRAAVEQWEPATEVVVPAYRLDDYAEQHGLSPALIKIDVEGGELRVLGGATRVFERFRPTLVVELHADSGHRDAVYGMLSVLGYDVSALPDDCRLAPLTRDGFLTSDCANFVFAHDPAIKALLRSAPPG